jgi:hypothetical protein
MAKVTSVHISNGAVNTTIQWWWNINLSTIYKQWLILYHIDNKWSCKQKFLSATCHYRKRCRVRTTFFFQTTEYSLMSQRTSIFCMLYISCCGLQNLLCCIATRMTQGKEPNQREMNVAGWFVMYVGVCHAINDIHCFDIPFCTLPYTAKTSTDIAQKQIAITTIKH